MNIERIALVVSGLVLAAGGMAQAQVEPGLGTLPDGNLRVDLRCADYWATPADGLQVTIDGLAPPSTGTNGANMLVDGRHGTYEAWVPTDIGFALAPGPHRLVVAAPGCASFAGDIVTPTEGSTVVQGRLAINDPALLGTTAAPDHIGIAFGGLAGFLPSHSGVTTLGPVSTAYVTDAATLKGGWLSISYEHRRFAAALDTSIAVASSTGTLTPITEQIPDSQNPGPIPYSDTLLDFRTAARVGMRVPMGSVALAGGAGLGISFLGHIPGQNQTSIAVAEPPNGLNASVFVPVWASLTVKPGCNAGFQILASYDVHPTDSSENAVTIGAGLLWQPSDACSQAPGVRIRDLR